MAPLLPSHGQRLADAPVRDQLAALERGLQHNAAAQVILHRAGQLELPSWYLGAGAVSQTIWNELHGFEPAEGIKDYDLAYFDPTDLSVDAEQAAEGRARAVLAELDITLDVKNQARVHLWYSERFGRSVDAYRSTEHAISTWPTTASSIGVRYEGPELVVCAPFGLRDLFAMIVRPNRVVVPQAVYEEKAQRWATRWTRLTVLPW